MAVQRNRSETKDVDFASLIKLYDHYDMASVIEGAPRQIDFAIADENFPRFSRQRYEKVAVIGMGGSALPIDVISDAFTSKLSCPILIHRNYGIPSRVDNRTLIVLSSFSGTTEETLSALEFVEPEAENVVVLTANDGSEGDIIKTARERKLPIISIPKAREVKMFQPRCATAYFVTYFARLLMSLGLLDDVYEELRTVSVLLRNKCSETRSTAMNLALQLNDQIPIFYTDQNFERSIARVAKIKFNENAKRPAFFNVLPEANHNEMIGFSRPLGNFAIIYLKDPHGIEKNHKRFEVMEEVFKSESYDHVRFYTHLIGDTSPLGKIFLSHMFVDWLTYFTALIDEVDPTPVGLVETFKKQLVA